MKNDEMLEAQQENLKDEAKNSIVSIASKANKRDKLLKISIIILIGLIIATGFIPINKYKYKTERIEYIEIGSHSSDGSYV